MRATDAGVAALNAVSDVLGRMDALMAVLAEANTGYSYATPDGVACHHHALLDGTTQAALHEIRLEVQGAKERVDGLLAGATAEPTSFERGIRPYAEVAHSGEGVMA